MPSTATNDSWKPTSKRLLGLNASIITAAKARTLRDMREPPNSEATEQSVSIVVALTTEGDIPTTKTYAQMVTSVNNMDNLR